MTNKKPFEPERDFVQVHYALFTLYTKLEDFHADDALAYIVLMKNYNVNYGYAFPSTWDLMEALNVSESTVTAIKETLKKYALIETGTNEEFGNNVYYVFAPITDEEEFYATYPQAKERNEQRKAKHETRVKGGKERKRKHYEKAKKQVEEPVVTTTDDSGEDLSDWI